MTTPQYEVANQGVGKWNVGDPVRVSEDGKMAVAEKDPNHKFWAIPELVDSSNTVLEDNKSVIRLKALGGTLESPAPNGSGARSLNRVTPENKSNGTSGDTMKLWADCGKSCRDVVGAGEGTGWVECNVERMTASYRELHTPWYSEIPILGPVLSWIFGGPRMEEKKNHGLQPGNDEERDLQSAAQRYGRRGLEKVRSPVRRGEGAV